MFAIIYNLFTCFPFPFSFLGMSLWGLLLTAPVGFYLDLLGQGRQFAFSGSKFYSYIYIYIYIYILSHII